MPAKSKAQQRLFQMAEHNPGALSGKNAQLASLPHQTLHEFASGSEKGKPEHVGQHPHKNLGAYLHKKKR